MTGLTLGDWLVLSLDAIAAIVFPLVFGWYGLVVTATALVFGTLTIKVIRDLR